MSSHDEIVATIRTGNLAAAQTQLETIVRASDATGEEVEWLPLAVRELCAANVGAEDEAGAATEWLKKIVEALAAPANLESARRRFLIAILEGCEHYDTWQVARPVITLHQRSLAGEHVPDAEWVSVGNAAWSGTMDADGSAARSAAHAAWAAAWTPEITAMSVEHAARAAAIAGGAASLDGVVTGDAAKAAALIAAKEVAATTQDKAHVNAILRAAATARLVAQGFARDSLLDALRQSPHN